VTIGLTISPVGATTGSVSVDNDGKLHIHGSTKVNILVRQIGEPYTKATQPGTWGSSALGLRSLVFPSDMNDAIDLSTGSGCRKW
jgi:hypothetical protein